MKRILLILAGLGLAGGLLFWALPRRSADLSSQQKLAQSFPKKHTASVDHGKFAQLKGPFARPQDVTSACLSCHNGRHEEVMKSSHWNWERTEFVPDKGIRRIGKRNVLNNFCIGIGGNQQSCNKCHAGYGYGDETFDFKNPLNIDCLACHDSSATYVKAAGGAGMPAASVDLGVVARSVGRPSRTNCGTCHFFGGGGNNVKHGDLEKALFNPSKKLDVHMAAEGADMACVDCHTAEKHQMLGKMYSVSSMNRDRVACESCHGTLPHHDDTLDRHTLKVACQTCHIPIYAKANPTKLTWDWSTAGRLKEGQPFEEKAADGTDSYMSIKGSFTWGKNLQPEYAWSNGTASHYLLGDPVEPGSTVKINELKGSYSDPDAKIIPVKVHRAKQIFDPENRILIQPKTVSNHPGDGGFWKEFNWQRAAEEGMKEVGLPYSGKYSFIDTEMTWPINHMVAPKTQAVGCAECHTRDRGRLDKLRDFYLPGRDRSRWLDLLGSLMVLGTVGGVLLHGLGRIIARKRRTERKG